MLDSESFQYQYSAAISPEVHDRLGTGLKANGFNNGGIRETKVDLEISCRDSDGQLIGGLTGDSLGPWLYVARLWVDDTFRGRGIAKRLMAEAEQEGIRRGCLAVFLHTFEYEAPWLYKKLGYRIVGQLEHPAIGHKRYYFQKDLTEPNP